MKHIDLSCNQCGHVFSRSLAEIKSNYKKGFSKSFCTHECYSKHKQKTHTDVICCQCKQSFKKPSRYCKKPQTNHFCSRSCSASFNNAHKTHGTRRSKLEAWIEEQLSKIYQFEIHFNQKDAINSELDIYIPSLRLAFELNGIYHYEPIHGPKKLAAVRNNDERKFQACIESNIELCIIDTSSMTYFKETKARSYLDIITTIIDSKPQPAQSAALSVARTFINRCALD